jgi:hypothetical protein
MILRHFAVVCGCETWSVALREEHRLKVSGNRVLSSVLALDQEEDGENCILSLVIYIYIVIIKW